MTEFFRLPPDKLCEFRAALGEPPSKHPDTTLAGSIVTQVARSCRDNTGTSPVLSYELRTRGDSMRATLVIEYVSCLTDNDVQLILNLSTQVCDVRFVFINELTGAPLTHGCIHVVFWRATVADHERRRTTYMQPKYIRLAPTYALDFAHLDADAEDQRQLTAVHAAVHTMHRKMPAIKSSAQKLYAMHHSAASAAVTEERSEYGADEQQCSRHTRRRTRSETAHDDDDDVAHRNKRSRGVRRDVQVRNGKSPHVGFCVFFEGVPSFGVAFLKHLKTRFGSIVLAATVVAPSEWRAPDDRLFIVPQMLAVSLRRTSCSEGDAGAYAVDGCSRLQRSMTRAAKGNAAIVVPTETS